MFRPMMMLYAQNEIKIGIVIGENGIGIGDTEANNDINIYIFRTIKASSGEIQICISIVCISTIPIYL